MGAIRKAKHGTPGAIILEMVPIKDDHWIDAITSVNDSTLIHVFEHQGKLLARNASILPP
jgi:hypothetical protein